ncbi:MAG: zinc-ribbon domain-containing protein, partial [Deltaproteobacteria bacterium]|nr:zinc-ribbon domain-containing protein [Deltaproteobacteria bacterium]
MKIECPECHFSAEADAARIPPGGSNTRCPRCATVFTVTPVKTGVPDGVQGKVVCPKCGAWQETAESCGLCGLIYEKFRIAEEHRQMANGSSGTEMPSSAAPLPATGQDSFHFGYGRGDLMTWASEGYLAADALPQALRIAGTLPRAPEWRRLLDSLALWMGAIFLAAAVIFFFAYNWKELGHFARFGIVELLLAVSVISAWRLGLEQMPGKAALLVATLLVGALLALVGQTYQTGADPWELFATWAIFVLPW